MHTMVVMDETNASLLEIVPSPYHTMNSNKGAFMFIPKVPFHAFSKRHKKEWLVRLIEWGSPYIVVLQLQYGGMDDLACE
eukprot:scaffold662_cov364-Pavlova_lutheri.AAC.18